MRGADCVWSDCRWRWAITRVKLGFGAVPDEIDEIERAMRFTVTEGELFGTGRGHHRGLCVAPSIWTFQTLPAEAVVRP